MSPIAGWDRSTRAFAHVGSGDPAPSWSDFRDPLDAIAGTVEPSRAMLFDDSSNLFRAMRDDPILGFSMADIGEIAGKDKSTVSRQLGRSAKSGESEVLNG